MTVDHKTSGSFRARRSAWRRQCAVMAGLFVGSLVLAACGASETAFPTSANRRSGGDGASNYQQPDTVFGEGGFNIPPESVLHRDRPAIGEYCLKCFKRAFTAVRDRQLD